MAYLAYTAYMDFPAYVWLIWIPSCSYLTPRSSQTIFRALSHPAPYTCQNSAYPVTLVHLRFLTSLFGGDPHVHAHVWQYDSLTI